jgi:DNA-binding HxlR family transcriptional regulator
LDQLEDAVGANDALDRMLEEREAAEILLRRRSRGVPVYYVMTSHGRALRLVRTRWGWGGSPEIE